MSQISISRTKVEEKTWSRGLLLHFLKERTAYLFVLPILILYSVFSLYPIIQTFVLSFFDAKIVRRGPFVGIENYIDIFAAKGFRQAMGNTFLFTFGSIAFILVVSLTLAILTNISWVRFKTIFKMIYFLPVVTSAVAVGYIWKWMMDSSFGIINVILGLVGIQPGPNWLSDPNIAIWSLIIVNVWKWIGYFLIIFSANLQSIDPTYYEVSQIDGANSWQQLVFITLPLMRQAIVLSIILGIVNFLKGFALVFVMTQGGPAGTTELMATYVYKEAFGTGQLRFGFSAAASVVLFALIMIMTLSSNKAGKMSEVDL